MTPGGPASRKARAAGLLLAVALLLATAAAASAQNLIPPEDRLKVEQPSLTIDVSTARVAITTNFTGTELVVFGALDAPGDIAVTVTGPPAEMVVRRKDRIAGVWLNASSTVFTQAPSFYAVAANRPFEELAPLSILTQHGIGLDHLAVVPEGTDAAESIRRFREALIRHHQRLGLYPEQPGRITYLSPTLFRFDLDLPATVPTGLYLVEVHLFRGGIPVSRRTDFIEVRKAGFSAGISDFASDFSLYYGMLALAFAIGAGWSASALFRNS